MHQPPVFFSLEATHLYTTNLAFLAVPSVPELALMLIHLARHYVYGVNERSVIVPRTGSEV
jgi:hypothetical protein